MMEGELGYHPILVHRKRDGRKIKHPFDDFAFCIFANYLEVL
jgi:hypothetical protein